MSGSRLAYLASLTLAFLLSGFASADNELDRIAAESKLAASKVESQANLALAESRAFINARQYARAQDTLDQALVKVKNSPDLSDAVRTNLQQRLLTRLREVEQHLQAQQEALAEAVRQQEERDRRDRINQKTKESGGNGTSNIAKDRITSVKDQIAAAERLKAKRGEAMLGVINGLQPTVIAGDIEFHAHWKQIVENRKRFAGPQLTAKEAELLKALNSYMTPNFDKQPFRQVMEYIMEKTGQAIIIDENSLKDAMVEYDDPVDFTLKTKITVRTILKKILADKGLSYIIRDGAIQVMTAARAKEITVVRAYPVNDLVGDAFTINGAINAQSLIQTIQNAIDPGYWRDNGGPGTITYHPQTGTLIIRASAELHYMLGAGGLFK